MVANRSSGVKKMKANLSSDIVESNILSRLPVKTLIRFTTVCKSWYSLLSDPYFINSYNQIQKNRTNNLLLINSTDKNRIEIINSCSNEQSSSFSQVCSSFKSAYAVGCCDGIVCVYYTYFNKSVSTAQTRISLWNPALRINKIVGNFDDPYQCVGFGYHNQTNDYKVIKFTNEFWTIKHVEIYSLASDSWRNIALDSNQLFTYIIDVGDMSGVYVSCCLGSGAFCWSALKLDANAYDPQWFILSFDMEDEVFKEMAFPYTSLRSSESTVFIYKDSLAVLHTHDSDAFNQCDSRICNIWVMKEYGDPMSWTMLCEFDSQRPYVSYFFWLQPYVSFVGVVETDLILVLRGEGRWWKPIKKEVNVVDIDKSQMYPTSYTKDLSFLTEARWVSSFTESLALLKEIHS